MTNNFFNCNFSNTKKNEDKNKSTDAAFDEFCKRYLNSSNGFYLNAEQKKQAQSLKIKEKIYAKSSLAQHTKREYVEIKLNLNKNTSSSKNHIVLNTISQNLISNKNKTKPESLKIELNRPKNSDNFYLLKNLNSFYSSAYETTNDMSRKTKIPIIKINQDTINKENDSVNIKPFVVSNQPNLDQKQENKLGLKLVSCGMNKQANLPIPKSNFCIDKGDFGDDAGFWCENSFGEAFGVADGASGNSKLGYDPGDFSRNLMQLCSDLFSKENKLIDAKSLILKAYDKVQDKTCYGSCTACVLTLDNSSNILTAANVGDTGFCVFRHGKLIHQSVPERVTFECPRQLDSYPWKEKSRRMGVSYTDILGNETKLEKFQVKKDDLIIVSSDGLFDNLDPHEIEHICQKSKSLAEAVESLVFRSVKYYRKPDDILVLIAKVVNNKTSTKQQKFTQDPNSLKI